MKRLRALISRFPFAIGIAVLLLLYFFDRWFFATFFHVPYWQWYLKNGALIALVSAIVFRIWGDAADKHTGLISSHPLDYLGSWFQFIGLPFYALGTQIKQNRDRSLSRFGVDGLLVFIWMPILFVFLLAWFVVILPLQFLVYFVCGAPVRYALESDRVPLARFGAGSSLDVDEAYKYPYRLLRTIDLKDARRLTSKLLEPHDPVSSYLNSQLSPELKQQMMRDKDSRVPPIQLQQALINELNELLRSDLAEKTGNEIKKPDPDEAQILRNRRLLEKCYPDAIAPSLFVADEPPDNWWDASFSRKPVSMTNALAVLLLWFLQRLIHS